MGDKCIKKFDIHANMVNFDITVYSNLMSLSYKTQSERLKLFEFGFLNNTTVCSFNCSTLSIAWFL